MNKYCKIWKQKCVGEKCGVYSPLHFHCKLDTCIGRLLCHTLSFNEITELTRFFEEIRPVVLGSNNGKEEK